MSNVDATALNQFRLALCVLDTNLSDTPGSAAVRVKIRKLIYNTLASPHNLQEYKDGWDEIADGVDSLFLVSYSKVSVAMHCVFESLQILIQPMLADGWAEEENP